MKKVTRVSAATLAVVLSLSSIPSNADWIGDFYTAAGAGANFTPPTAIATQSVVGYSGGGLSWRVPNRNFQPVSIRPPSLKAGCGGIDAYLGAFSFPNKDAFVQALRNFGQASVGYFFELALRTMAPEIAVTLDVINDLATRVNQFSINSCAAAKKAVNAIAGDWMDAHARDASGYAAAAGKFVDFFSANDTLSKDGKGVMEEKYERNYSKPPSSILKDDVGKFDPVKVNVLYWALQNVSKQAFSSSISLSDDEIEVIMSLIGPSVIFRTASASDGTEAPAVEGEPKTLEFKDILGENSISTTTVNAAVNILKCNSSDPECLYPVKTSIPVDTFSMRISYVVNAVKNSVSSRSPLSLSTSDANVLNLTSVPIYRAVAMSQSAGVGALVSSQLVVDLADYAALDAAYRMVSFYLSAAEKALSVAKPKLPQTAGDGMRAMNDRIQYIKRDMVDQISHYYKQKGDPYEKINQLDKVERAMYGNLNVMLAANARFGKR